MKNYLLTIPICILVACQTQQTPDFDADTALQYCTSQVHRTLDTLQQDADTCDYTMQPRNILKGETHWNCRKAAAEEWCSGFWPGVLWMTYEYTRETRRDI